VKIGKGQQKEKLSAPTNNQIYGVCQHLKLGWWWQREKIDWQEACKFDCWLVWMIFIFCCPLSIFTRQLKAGEGNP